MVMSKIPLVPEASDVATSGAGAGAALSLPAGLFAVLVAHMTIRTNKTLVALLPKAICVLARFCTAAAEIDRRCSKRYAAADG